MKKRFGEYYLGFDIGTDSVGWAATRPNYEILKCNGKSMWGIHLFESGKPAADRRMMRTARRRAARVAQRAALLRELFRTEITACDADFFERLADSKFFPDDKAIPQKNTLFDDDPRMNNALTDKSYHTTYPTIYHLRSSLMHDAQSHDVRLVYLALHHLIKHRGHFLFEGQNFEAVTSFEVVFRELIQTLNDEGLPFDYVNADEIERVMKDQSLGVMQKKKRLAELMHVQDVFEHADEYQTVVKQKKAITNLLAGGKVALSELYNDVALNECEVPKISFSDGIDEISDTLSDCLGERMFLLNKLKALYDWSVLIHILNGQRYLSDAKVAVFEEHKADLKCLKAMVKKYLTPAEKRAIFNNAKPNTKQKGEKKEKALINYPSYVQHKMTESEKTCTQKDFCDALKKKFAGITFETAEEQALYQKLEDGTALPKQVSKENSVIPYQLHLAELREILDNAQGYLPFLCQKDEAGISVREKIESLLTFRIPYYVGPLNGHCKEHAWIQKRSGMEHEKIYPWNFDSVVDKEASADAFILRMTNQCTYLAKADVLAKNSILYSKYNILNQLNNVRVNGEKLRVEVKQQIFEDLFWNVKRPAKVTFKKLIAYFKQECLFATGEPLELSGVDGEIVGDVKAHLDFTRILGENVFTDEIVDEVVQKIVILGENKALVKDYLQRKYAHMLTEKQISELAKLNYTGWGNFSKEFLTQIYQCDFETGEILGENIITALFETQENLMELLSNRYLYQQSIQKYNEMNAEPVDGITAKILEDLYVSPAVKRGIWRVLMLAKEVVKVTGHAPSKIFIEVARDLQDNGKKGKRTVSRKQQLLELYKTCAVEAPLFDALQNEDEGKLRSESLYLYYMQLGRCMYSGERIDVSALKSGYDVDHIYPQSRVKDDSIAANKVLVKRVLNEKKSDKYPIPQECLQSSVFAYWSMLRDKKLITKEKYERLTRRTPFSENELSGFIARQLVETRQSTKAVANVFKSIYPTSQVVYVKAGNVSRFRQDYNLLKSRLVNDYHHAVDAYLNVVVGNVFDEKFTVNRRYANDALAFIQSGQAYSMNRVFDYPVIKGERVVWQSKHGESIAFVKREIAKKKILFTRYATVNRGAFFDQNPVKAGKGQLPIKTTDARLAKTERYGAYNSIKGACFFLAEHTLKKKRVRTVEYIPVYLLGALQNVEALRSYAAQTLGLKDVAILIPCIKINALFCVDGFYMHLSGRTGSQLLFKGAMPLVLSPTLYQYAKRIEKYIERNKEQRTVYPITSYQKITAEENLALYDELLHKLRDTVYRKKLSSQVKTFESGRSKFVALPLENQCELLYNAFGLFDTSPNGTDLTLIGGSGLSGKLLISNNVNSIDEVLLVHQSVTGLFEQVVDLKSPDLKPL